MPCNNSNNPETNKLLFRQRMCSSSECSVELTFLLFWELTWLVAHSLAAPVDTVEALAARSSPCLPRRHSSRFCAQCVRTSSCGDTAENHPHVVDCCLEDKRCSYLFLWRDSAPEYALPWYMSYWSGVPQTSAKVRKAQRSGSTMDSRFMLIGILKCWMIRKFSNLPEMERLVSSLWRTDLKQLLPDGTLYVTFRDSLQTDRCLFFLSFFFFHFSLQTHTPELTSNFLSAANNTSVTGRFYYQKFTLGDYPHCFKVNVFTTFWVLLIKKKNGKSL